jgi:predicted nucleic acid-binding protein
VTYLLDTDYVVDWLHSRRNIPEVLARLSPDGVALSLMTYGEIYEGIYRARDPQAAEAVFRRFLRDVPVLPLSRAILRHFARISGNLHAAGLHIGDADILIAATAIQHDLTLLTRNQRHFQRIAGLRLDDPSGRP